MDTNLLAARAPSRSDAKRTVHGFNRCILRSPRTSAVSTSAFSLVEMMVVMSLLSVIVLGLYSVFNTTQRALISNNAQVDVLENGRTTLDLVGREIEQAVAWGQRDYRTNLSNFWIQLQCVNPTTQQPYKMTLNDGTIRTNLIEECFFLSRSNNWWLGNGFFLAMPTNGTYLTTNDVAISGVGTLYRFSDQPYDPILRRYTPTFRLKHSDFVNLTNAFLSSRIDATKAFPIAEGITHFALRPYDAGGRLMTNNYDLRGQLMTNMWTYVWTNGTYARYSNPNILCQRTSVPGEYNWQFYSNSLPAYIDLELGIVQPYILQRMRSIPNAVAQRDYLSKQPGAVNIFHKMILLRNAQP